MATNTTPAAFADFDVIEGFEPVDKAALVGVPFGVTSVRFRTNERSVVYAEAELVTGDGEQQTMIDSSTGVRDQLAAYLKEKGLTTGGNTDWQDVKLFVPNGLRCSQYSVKVEGEDKLAKTYYLTTKPRRR